jgi:predicted nucleic acid-binding protein
LNIILDTNIIRSDFKLKSAEFSVILDYLTKTNSKVIMTAIAFEELTHLYTSELKKRLEVYQSAVEKINPILSNVMQIENINIESETSQYLNYLMLKLEFSDSEIIPYKDSYMKEVVHRAINKIKPCSNKGEEFRDTILWLTVLDIAENTNDKQIIFISNNTKEFASESGQELHADLYEETQRRGVRINYFNSLKHFIKSHASTFSYINEEWINDQINIEEINERFVEIIKKDWSDNLLQRLNSDYNTADYINPISAYLSIDEFFVYEKTDGSLYLEVMLSGEVEIEFEHEVDEKVEIEDWDYKYSYNPFTDDYEREREKQYKFITETRTIDDYYYPEFDVRLVADIEDKKIKTFSIKDIYL